MKEKQNSRLYLILNGLALIVFAANLTGPVHEAAHMLTQMAAGMQPDFWAFGVNGTKGAVSVDLTSFFWKLMFEGSAAFMNIVVGFICFFVLRRKRLGSLSRVFLLHLTMMHMSMGFGYFLRDGIAYTPGGGMGDWSKVLERFGGSLTLRVGMLAVGSLGILFVFSLAYWEAFRFIRASEDRAERRAVASAIYLWPYLFQGVALTLLGLVSPLGTVDSLVIHGITNFFGMIAFFWGYMFVAHLVKPPKAQLFYFSPCAEKRLGLWLAAAALLAFDAFILCPGIYF